MLTFVAVKIHIGELSKIIRELGPELTEACKESAWAAVEYGVKSIRRTIDLTKPYPPKATLEYKEGWRAVRTRTGGMLENKTKQALWIEEGRQPGAAPIAPFLKWAATKVIRGQIGGKPLTMRQLAFLARAKVVKKGFKPRRIAAQTVPKIKKELHKELRQRLKAMGLRLGKSRGRVSVRVRE